MQLESKAELARRVGVSRAAITKACKGLLAPGMDGDRVDLDHPVVVEYMRRKGVNPGKPAAKKKSKAAPARPSQAPVAAVEAAPGPKAKPAKGKKQTQLPGIDKAEDAASIEAYASLTLRQLVAQFGTVRALRDWLDALKKIEDIREKRISNEQDEGSLISRDLVAAHVFGAVDGANRRLLSDTPKTIARRVRAQANAGATLEESERTVRDLISDQLTPMQDQVKKRVKDA